MHTRFFAAIGLAFALAACGTPTAGTSPTAASSASANAIKVGSLTITDPWARASAMADMAMPTVEAGMAMPTVEAGMAASMGEMQMGASYMTIANSGAADTLIAASTDAAESVELHTVTDNNGVMQMRQVEGGIEIPANGSVELKPGGFHVMLIGLKKPLAAGETVNLKLQFAKAGEVTVAAQVRQ